jgi:hypothetical protein
MSRILDSFGANDCGEGIAEDVDCDALFGGTVVRSAIVWAVWKARGWKPLTKAD